MVLSDDNNTKTASLLKCVWLFSAIRLNIFKVLTEILHNVCSNNLEIVNKTLYYLLSVGKALITISFNLH